jgi:hypothetical protein
MISEFYKRNNQTNMFIPIKGILYYILLYGNYNVKCDEWLDSDIIWKSSRSIVSDFDAIVFPADALNFFCVGNSSGIVWNIRSSKWLSTRVEHLNSRCGLSIEL